MANHFRNVVRVILDCTSDGPSCTHGPMLLFERNHDVTSRYYACSAYRDRKQCPAFVSFSDWCKTKQQTNHVVNEKTMPNNLLEISYQMESVRQTVLPAIKNQNPEKRYYCHTCNQLTIEKKPHLKHEVTSPITDDDLSSPLQLIHPLNSNKKEAQFLFTPATREVITSIIKCTRATHCLCIASPTIFQHLRKATKLKCLMLDLDVRLRQFFGPEDYLLYNMFNHHFFDEPAGKAFFAKFLKESKGKLALVIDPPFGGKVDVLAHTLKKISEQYSLITHHSSKISVFLILPYFMEPQVIRELPGFAMMDYKVNYLNHKQFQDGEKGRKQGSPVRIFTNFPLENVSLPKEEGYSYCEICKKWKSKENRHCRSCGFCTSKDGRTYVHCDSCNRCVKPTWIHCVNCNRCALKVHPCDRFRMSGVSIKKINNENCPVLSPTDGLKRKRIEYASSKKKTATSKWNVTSIS